MGSRNDESRLGHIFIELFEKANYEICIRFKVFLEGKKRSHQQDHYNFPKSTNILFDLLKFKRQINQ